MKRMAGSSVFLSGLSGLGAEIAKNIVLTGVKAFTLHDQKETVIGDLSTQFFLTPEDVGTNRAVASAPKLAELNPSVAVNANAELDLATDDLDPLSGYKCVILVDAPLATQIRVSEFCHSAGVVFIATELRGIGSWVFVDVGDDFEVTDVDGEPIISNIVKDISSAEPGVVSTLERHGLQDGQTVRFTEVKGMTELNGSEHVVTVVDAKTFSIGDTSGLSPYTAGGIATQVKVPVSVSSDPLGTALENPQVSPADYGKFGRLSTFPIAARALHAFAEENNGEFPRVWNAEDGDAVVAKAKELAGSEEAAGDLDEDYIRTLAYTSRGACSPLSEFMGGFVAQEGLKALSHKFSPLKQFMYLDATEVVPPLDTDPSGFAPVGDRYDGLRACVGSPLVDRLGETRLFMVGSGAIGCEMLKNFALLGVGRTGEGAVIVTDNDVIETSNLSRQFLFRSEDVQRPKSEVAAEAAMRINPDMRVDARLDRVGQETEDKYNNEFISSLDACVNALDNIEARLYMDSRAVDNARPLLESGTLGTKGHVQVVVPFLTESYGSTRDPPEKEVPFCTLKSFPSKIDHTIQFARDKFQQLFTNYPGEVNKFFAYSAGPVADQLEPNNASSIVHVLLMIDQQPTTFEECVARARLMFQEYFHDAVLQLLHAFPPDLLLKDGTPFWSLPKRAPHPIMFDPEDETHIKFLAHTARLMGNIWGIAGVEEAHKDSGAIAAIAAGVEVPEFVPKDNVKIETDENAEKPKGGDDEGAPVDDDELPALIERVKAKIGAEDAVVPSLEVEEFEKDDNSNSHIDFIHAFANLRARAYDIDEVDVLEARRIAGKIIPAISTTTGAVSGLATLELLKLLMGCELEAYRNTFLNLAIPMVALSEPGEAPKLTFTEDTTFTLWDRWELSAEDTPTIADIISHFASTYDGVSVAGIFAGSKALYLPTIVTHKKRLKKSVAKLAKVKPGVVLDLIVSFEGPGGEELEGPIVRYHT